MYKITIGLIICILLVSATASSVIGNKIVEKTSNVVSYDRNILYVGGTGPNNYTKIQDAIDDASDGDTVFVYNGIYYENITIDKSISLIGEDKNTTVIDGIGEYHVVDVKAKWVNISGFSIENTSWSTGSAIVLYSNYNNISGNIISDLYSRSFFSFLLY